jgi:hypothetical protein
LDRVKGSIAKVQQSGFERLVDGFEGPINGFEGSCRGFVVFL